MEEKSDVARWRARKRLPSYRSTPINSHAEMFDGLIFHGNNSPVLTFENKVG